MAASGGLINQIFDRNRCIECLSALFGSILGEVDSIRGNMGDAEICKDYNIITGFVSNMASPCAELGLVAARFFCRQGRLRGEEVIHGWDEAPSVGDGQWQLDRQNCSSGYTGFKVMMTPHQEVIRLGRRVGVRV